MRRQLPTGPFVAVVVVLCVFFFERHGVVQAQQANAGLSFPEALKMAQDNPRMLIAVEQINEAEARLAEARGAKYPRIRATSFLAPSPEVHCVDEDCTRTEPDEATIDVAGIFGGAELRIAQPLFTFGKIAAGTKAARSGLEMARSEAAVEAGRQAEQVAKAYFGVKLSRELIEMLEEGRVEVVDASAKVLEKLDAGSPDVDLQDQFRLSTLQADIDLRLADAREAHTIALAGLRALVGDPVAEVDGELLQVTMSEDLSDPVKDPAVAVARRADLQGAKQRRKAASFLVDLELARFLPDLVLVGELKFARAQGVDNPPSAFADDPFHRTSAGLALVLNWEFDPAIQRARAERARARVAQARYAVDTVSTVARFEIQEAQAKVRNAEARFQTSRRGAKQARGWLASVLQGQALGLSESKDLADAMKSYFAMRAANLGAAHDWNIAVVKLRRASGAPLGNE